MKLHSIPSVSLEEINNTVPVPQKNASFLKKLFAYSGPGALVAVGYMDPGNWITSIQGGALYSYLLLSVILISSLIAMLLQAMCAKLGIVTGLDLAQATKLKTGRKLSVALWLTTELAIMATEIAEVIGSAIALNLLFNIPLMLGVIITVLDVLLLLALMMGGFRKIEAFVFTLILTIFVIFGYEVILDVIGRQNTLMVNTADASNTPVTNRYSRVYVHNSLIAGDVDYVFGQADAVFDHVEFHTLSSRGVKQASIFAPNTPANVPYGFLVIDSNLTADKGFTGKDVNKAQLGRAWDAGVDKDGYVANQTANSQLVIRDSQIDGSSYDLVHPWGNAAFSDRPFSGNIGVNRDLNDANFNRLWQYNNVFTGEK